MVVAQVRVGQWSGEKWVRLGQWATFYLLDMLSLHHGFLCRLLPLHHPASVAADSCLLEVGQRRNLHGM